MRVKTEFRDGRLYLHRTEAERLPIAKRLLRIEGQVRGIREMVEQDRYCPDELQQVNAAIAALRAVAMLLVEQHLTASAEYAGRSDDADSVLRDMMNVLQAALKH